MATLVFRHVALRVCNAEPSANPRVRTKHVQIMLKALTCMAKLSVDLGVL